MKIHSVAARGRVTPRCVMKMVVFVLSVMCVSGCSGAVVAGSRHVLSIGAGPFVLDTGCLREPGGPKPSELPFPLRVLEDEMQRELVKAGIPVLPPGSTTATARALRFGVCVWAEEDGKFWYRVTLLGPSPEKEAEEIENVSSWPMEMGTIEAPRLREKLLHETRRVAHEFARAVGAPLSRARRDSTSSSQPRP
jgi:hypothetical protein